MRYYLFTWQENLPLRLSFQNKSRLPFSFTCFRLVKKKTNKWRLAEQLKRRLPHPLFRGNLFPNLRRHGDGCCGSGLRALRRRGDLRRCCTVGDTDLCERTFVWTWVVLKHDPMIFPPVAIPVPSRRAF